MTKKSQNKSEKRFQWIALGIVLVFTAVLFGRSLDNEILYGWDDGEYITDPAVRSFDVEEIFTRPFLGMYQPIAVVTLAWNYHTSGENPVPYHSANLLLHLINTLLVYLLIRRMTGRIDTSVLISLLFAIHPMHVESVTWIATRSNLVYSFFYLLALIFYLRYLETKKWYLYLAVFVLFVLACFSKVTAITLPVLLWLFDYYNERKRSFAVILEKIPMLLISLAFGLIAVHYAGQFGHIKELSEDYNIFDRLILLAYSIVFYIVKFFAPAHLSAVYAFPLKEGSFLPGVYYFGAFLFIVLAFNVVILGKSRKTVVFGLLFFLITIGPVLPLQWSRMLMLADRYTYLPYLGLFYMVARLYIRLIETEAERIYKYRIFINTGIFFYLLFLIITTYNRTEVWRDTETLVNDVIAKERGPADMAIGHFFRGNLYDMKGQPEKALQDFSRAIELNPKYTVAYNNRGIVNGMLGNYQAALNDFNKAIELNPEYADAYYNRGNVNYYLKQFIEACSDWSQAAYLGSPQAAEIKKKYCK
ncbi:MAG: tetratricopeptide repeat protein [Bacteroidales bacterium]